MHRRNTLPALALALLLGLLLLPAPTARAAVQDGLEELRWLTDSTPGERTFSGAVSLPAPEKAGFGSQEAVITKAAKVLDGSGGELTLWPDGIILGADLTLRNMTLTLSSNTLPAIIANGHTLTLENVTLVSTYEPVVFCGTVVGYEDKAGTSLTVPPQGPGGTVIVRGGSIPRICGGSMLERDSSASGTVSDLAGTIAVSGGARVGTIQAMGLQRAASGSGSNWVLRKDSAPRELALTLDGPTAGGVGETVISGETQAAVPVTVTYRDSRPKITAAYPVLTHLTRLEVLSGTVSPAAGSTFRGGAGQPPTGLKLAPGAVLDLTQMGEWETVSYLEGGGSLVLGNTPGELGQNQRFTVTAKPSGTTSVAFGGLNRNEDGSMVSRNQPVEGSPYLFVQGQDLSDQAFRALPEMFGNPSYLRFEPIDGGGQWVGSHSEQQPEPEPEAPRTVVRSITAPQSVVTVYTHADAQTLNGTAEIPLEVVYDGEDGGFLSSVPVEIYDHGESGNCTRTQQPNTGYSYETVWSYVPHVLFFEVLDSGDEGLMVEPQEVDGKVYPLSVGEHQLTLTVPEENSASGQPLKVQVTLKVVEGAPPLPVSRDAITDLSVGGGTPFPAGPVTASVSLELKAPQAGATLAVAAYDSRGRLLGVHFTALEAGETRQRTVSVTVDPGFGRIAGLKAMLLTVQGSAPMAPAVELPR